MVRKKVERMFWGQTGVFLAQGYKATWEGRHPPLEGAVEIAMFSERGPCFHQSKKVKELTAQSRV